MKNKIIYTSGLIFLIGLVISSFVSGLVFDIESKTIANETKKEIDHAAVSINKELNISNELFHSMSNHILSDKNLNSSIFKKIATRIIDREPYIKNISIVNYHQIQNNSLNLQIKYSYPNDDLSTLKTAYLSENGQVHQALNMSLEKKVPVIIFNLLLNNLFDVNNGFFFISPINNNKVGKITPLSDFILSFISINDLLRVSASDDLLKNMNLSFIDVTNDAYESRYHSIIDIYSYNNKPMFFESSPIYFAGKKWVLTGIPTYEYLTEKLTDSSLIIFLLGILIFTLVSFGFYLIQVRLLHAYQLIDNQSIKLKDLSSQLDQLNKKDKLTDFYHIDYFISVLDNDIKQATKCKQAISLILIEIDNADDFTKEKGTFETLALIKTISCEVKKSIPTPQYTLSRYDHYKFSLITLNLEDTSFIMESCLRAIRNLNINVQGNKISLSLGSVTVMDLTGISSEMLINEAEKSLARARLLGGDQYIQIVFNKITPASNNEADDKK